MCSRLEHNLRLYHFSICARSCVVLPYRCLCCCAYPSHWEAFWLPMLSCSFLPCQVVLICLAERVLMWSKKNSYWVSLFYRNNSITKVYFSWDPSFLILLISLLHCMDLQPYSHDHFSKILRTFFASRNWWIIVVFLQCTLKEKSLFVLINTLLLHIPLLALTDWRNYGQRDKYTHCAWAGGNYFPVVLFCQFLGFWQEKGFGFTYLRI